MFRRDFLPFWPFLPPPPPSVALLVGWAHPLPTGTVQGGEFPVPEPVGLNLPVRGPGTLLRTFPHLVAPDRGQLRPFLNLVVPVRLVLPRERDPGGQDVPRRTY